MGRRLDRLLDYSTDLAGITALTCIALRTDTIPIEVVTAITTIALGQSYAKAKWDRAYGTTNQQSED